MSQNNSGYGILQRTVVSNETDKAVEDITKKGFSVVKSQFTSNQIKSFSKLLDSVHKRFELRDFCERTSAQSKK